MAPESGSKSQRAVRINTLTFRNRAKLDIDHILEKFHPVDAGIDPDLGDRPTDLDLDHVVDHHAAEGAGAILSTRNRLIKSTVPPRRLSGVLKWTISQAGVAGRI